MIADSSHNEIYVKSMVLVTGATGFVGHFLCERLLEQGFNVRGTLLSDESPLSLVAGVEPTIVKPLAADTPWCQALTGVDTIIHLAARVHIMRESATDPLHEFRRVNLSGTECLARQAAKAGVRRFVFMSTIGVNGDNSGDTPYTEGDVVNPHNSYSVSKYEAEIVLRQISVETGLEVIIIRAPLVYGPKNPGNFLSLLRVVSKKIPLPLASATNRRSLIYVGNLVSVLVACVEHPNAVGKTYLVSDGKDVSVSELIRLVAVALGVPARLFPFPILLMKFAGNLIRKRNAVNQLTGSLMVDSSRVRQELEWVPPYTLEEGLKETANWFKQLGTLEVEAT